MSHHDDQLPIQLACIDMAGTSVADVGAVEAAFLTSIAEMGVPEEDPRRSTMLDFIHETMGMSKIVVFRELFGEESLAEKANAAFEAAYGEQVDDGNIVALPGAAECFSELRENGTKVALTTGFSAQTRDRIIAALDWQDVADLLVCPRGDLRGRPFPDMIFEAIITLGVDSVANTAVIGDTTYDMLSGQRAGVAIVAGVLTGDGSREQLLDAGATDVLASIGDFAALLSR